MNPLNLTDHLKLFLNVIVSMLAGFLVKKGLDSNSAGIIAGALGSFAFAYISGWMQRSKLLNQPAPGQVAADGIASETTAAPQATTPAAGSGNITRSLSVLIALSLLAASGLAGCASMTVDQRLAAADQGLTTAMATLKIAVDDKIITDPKTLRAIDLTTQTASALLKKAHALRATTQPANAEFWIQQVEELLPTMNAFFQENAKEKTSCLWPQSSPLSLPLRKRSGPLETASNAWLTWPGRRTLA